MLLTPKEYAAKRQVRPQAVQRAIVKAQAYSLPTPLLPGVTAIIKQGRFYKLKVRGKIITGRPSKYFKH
jgi:hypothetical protein